MAKSSLNAGLISAAAAAADSARMFRLEHPTLSRASLSLDREENSDESEQENWSQLHSFSFPESGAQNRCGAQHAAVDRQSSVGTQQHVCTSVALCVEIRNKKELLITASIPK